MQWRDQGALLSVRQHGETSAIIEVFTAEHGRHLGVVRGGASRRIAPILQPGAQLDLTWRARLDEHIGSYGVEPLKSRAVAVMGDRMALAALNSLTSLLAFVLPERESHPTLYQRTIAVLDLLGTDPVWSFAYLRWEMALLEEMGFGLDLSCCAVTGSHDDLIYVSPKTGRAVSKAGAGEWADRLLPLPDSLLTFRSTTDAAIMAGLNVTGFFLESHLAPALGNHPLPGARQRFVERFARQPTDE